MGTTTNRDAVMGVFIKPDGSMYGKYAASWDDLTSMSIIAHPLVMLVVFKYNSSGGNPFRDNYFGRPVWFVSSKGGKLRISWTDDANGGAAQDTEYTPTNQGGHVDFRSWPSKQRAAISGDLSFIQADVTDAQITAARLIEESDCI